MLFQQAQPNPKAHIPILLSEPRFEAITLRRMINALLLIIQPVSTWERIMRNRRGVASVVLWYLLPLIALSCLAEGYGLVRWGKYRGEVAHLTRFSVNEAVVIEVAQFLLFLMEVAIGARMIKAVGETFHGRHTYGQTFTAVAYGMGPFFLFHLLDAFASLSPWIPWAIGILLTMGVLYHGLPRLMEPDPPHAFGLYLMSSLLLLFITGLVRFVTAWYLAGKLPAVDAVVSSLAGRLPWK